MEEIEIRSLLSSELFEKFCQQLRKDFEGAGLDGGFATTLRPDPDLIAQTLHHQIPFDKSTALSSLLYRIDISEAQIRQYSNSRPGVPFENIITELVIKRILQKVVLKKRYRPDDQERID